VEEGNGRTFIGEPVIVFPGHMASLFVTGKNPLAGKGTLQDLVNWTNDPLHSYIADGTGGLAVWAHPDPSWGSRILALDEGLVGMELYHGFDPLYYRDQLWDQVLQGRFNAGRRFVWAFASDDTHYSSGTGNYGLNWNVSLVPSADLFSVKSALRNGAFYVTNGPNIDTITVIGSVITLNLAQPSDVLWLRAGQYNTGAAFTETNSTGAARAVKVQQGVVNATLDVAALGLPVSSLKFVRAIVRTSSTQNASTQPFRILGDGSIANPYPSSGVWVKGQSHNHADTGIDGVPGTPLGTYRANYLLIDQQASFETAYSYWETPYQRLDSDGIPDLSSVTPAKVTEATLAEITVSGVNFVEGTTVQLGSSQLASVAVDNSTRIRATVPAGIQPGTYDLVVTTPAGYRGTLARGVSVQPAAADNTGWTTYRAPLLPWNQTTSVLTVGNEVWVGTVKGAAQFKNGVWSRFTPGSGFSRGIYAMAADASGSIWFSGVGMWNRTPAGTFPWNYELVNDPSGLSERWGKSAFDHSGNLWVNSRWSEGIAIRNPSGTWDRLRVNPDHLPLDDNQTILCDSEGNIWVGFGGGAGIQKWNGSVWQRVTMPAAMNLPSPYASALANGQNGDVWAAVHPQDGSPTLGGVIRFRFDGTTDVYKVPQLPTSRITDILVAKSGDVWFASRAGVARLSAGGAWTYFTAANSGLVSDVVTGLAETQNGTIWISTNDGISAYSPFDFALSSSGDLSIAPGDTGSTTITATDTTAAAPSIGFTVSGLPSGASGSFAPQSCPATCTTVLSVSVAAGTGPAAYTLSVTGTAGNRVHAVDVNLVVTGGTTNRAPTITNPGNQTSAEGAAVTLQISASDPDGNTLTYSATGLPTGLAINSATGAITGTVAVGAPATNNVVVTVSDGTLTDTASFTWTVTKTNRAPTVTNPGNQTSAEGAAVTLQITASDPDGNTLTYSATGLPTGLAINSATGLISGTTAAAGSYNVTIVVSDGSAQAGASFAWAVVRLNQAPTANAQTVTTSQDTPEAITLTASDPEGSSSLTFTVVTGPLHGTVSGTPPHVTYTPALDYNGADSFTFKANDGLADSNTATVSITISPAAIQFVARATVQNNSASSIAITRPGSVAANDLMVFGLTMIGTAAITAPAGWALVRNPGDGVALDTTTGTLRQAVFAKVATAGEPSSYTWTFGVGQGATGVLAVYRGIDTIAPLDVSAGQANPTSASITAPPITTRVDGTRLIGVFGMATTANIAAPAGMANRGQITGSKVKVATGFADVNLATAGSTGNRIAPASTAGVNIGQLLALRPSNAVGSQPPAAPATLTAAGGNRQVTLTWSASSGASGYNVYRSSVSGGPFNPPALASIDPSMTTYVDTAVANNTAYYYVVKAFNGNGESLPSPQASATPQFDCTAVSITLLPTSLPGGRSGIAYSQTISASGGVNPYAFSLASGSLPQGLAFSTSGILSGTPTKSAGGRTFNFTVRAVDANACSGSRAYQLTILK
jgi:fibronectin type 3 domain-containing protein